jgi:hypothetical protein
MFQFMMLQVLAIALLIIFPGIATTFPEYLQKVARETPVEIIKDDAPSLEQDMMETMQEQSEQDSKDAEKRDEQAPAQPK